MQQTPLYWATIENNKISDLVKVGFCVVLKKNSKLRKKCMLPVATFHPSFKLRCQERMES